MDLISVTWYLQAVSEDGLVIYTSKLTETEGAELQKTLFKMRGTFDDIDVAELTEPMRETLEHCLSSGLLSAEALGLICGIDAEALKAAAAGANIRLDLDQTERLAVVLHSIARNSAN